MSAQKTGVSQRKTIYKEEEQVKGGSGHCAPSLLPLVMEYNFVLKTHNDKAFCSDYKE